MKTTDRKRFRLKSAKPRIINKPKKTQKYIAMALMAFCFLLSVPFLLLALVPFSICFILWSIAIVFGVTLGGWDE